MPIGIGIIGIPPLVGAPVAPAAAAISAAGKPGPNPDIAELAMCAGIDPSQVGGTDIAPTNRALPNSPAMPAPRPPAPPSPFIPAGIASPASFGISAAAPAPMAAALAKPPELPFAICISDIIGDIIMLAGYIPICATCVKSDNGSAEAADSTDVTAPGTAETTVDTIDDNEDPCDASCEPACVAAPMTAVPNWPAHDDSPAKFTGGMLNGANVEATEVAPA